MQGRRNSQLVITQINDDSQARDPSLERKKLNQVKGHWPEELWGYNATVQSYTPETPYVLAFITEAMVPSEIAEPSFPRTTLNERNNSEALKNELDLVKEEQKLAQLREEATSPF
ncbi:hypothetical protein Cni_G09042 [Canna indica]|uniref:Uncharacterized protein n=1 Tax=Canna indica TaxID=4628 RepID=A0AAQ3Q7D0_9LILI|nr:hypothetical protein Cni_G09042 [Canna indica]